MDEDVCKGKILDTNRISYRSIIFCVFIHEALRANILDARGDTENSPTLTKQFIFGSLITFVNHSCSAALDQLVQVALDGVGLLLEKSEKMRPGFP